MGRLLIVGAAVFGGVAATPQRAVAESEDIAPASQSISVVVPEGCRLEPVWSIDGTIVGSSRWSLERWITEVVREMVIADACAIGWSLSLQAGRPGDGAAGAADVVGPVPVGAGSLVTVTLLA